MYHLHLDVIRVCAIRTVACAGRRRRRRWRLTHLAAAVVDILARTDQQGRTYTRHAVALPSTRIWLDPKIRSPQAGGKCRGKRKSSRGPPRSCRKPFRQPSLATKKGLRHRASRLRRRYSTIIVGVFGLLHREWREVAKEAVN